MTPCGICGKRLSAKRQRVPSLGRPVKTGFGWGAVRSAQRGASAPNLVYLQTFVP